ncbi:sugar phosphate isomerase/epimerase family protein [Streptosporangium sp. DT93]|uniref:sugar phosphate isomerase/epimerase family protein n=1 Tax=Streptosporangium sp. DT93 TaxID=3393428 RepID=UPI003CFA7EDA
MSLLQQQKPFFAHPHLVGSLWPEPPRDAFDDRVAAIAGVGSTGMGMGTEELDGLLAGRSAADLRAVLEHHGVHIGELEILIGWQDPDGEFGVRAKAVEERMHVLADLFGARRIKTSAVFPPGVPMPAVDVLTERFAALCDRAAAHGLSVELEPFAVFPGFTYAVAADVVLAADRPNGGLLIDTWHLFRDPTGLGALDRVEGRHITGLELGDGHAEPRGTLHEDCNNHRLLPGEGSFHLVDLVRALDAKGVDVPLSVEVISAELRGLTPAENARRTAAAVAALMEKAR